jgi:Ca-activated chloride channel family protein
MGLLRFSFAVLLLVLLALPNSQNTLSAQTTNAGLTMMTVTLTDRRGNYVMGLTSDAFKVTDENRAVPVKLFGKTDEPMGIGILVDTSSSMQLPEAQAVARPKPIGEAVVHFLELANAENEYFLMAFDESPRVLVDWNQAKELSNQKITITEAKKMTALYDSCFAAVEKLNHAHRAKRSLILFSDGLDSISKRRYLELRRLLRGTDVVLYAIAPRISYNRSDILALFGSALSREGQTVLVELAEITGGAVFYPENKEQLNRAVEQIAIEMRHQYRIGFQTGPAGVADKWHRIRVKVEPPPDAPSEFRKLTVRARQGFYSH